MDRFGLRILRWGSRSARSRSGRSHRRRSSRDRCGSSGSRSLSSRCRSWLHALAPRWAVLACSAGLSAQTIWGGEAAVVGGFLATIIVTHSVALYSTRFVAVAGLAVVLAGVHTYTFINLDEFRLADEIGNAAIFIIIWGLGRTVRSRQHRTEIAEAHSARVEAERDAHTQAARSEERSRIARELHDVVAHGVSVMVLQAGAARQMLGREPERARPPLLAVEDSGRQALEDMHRLLSILRRESDTVALAPIVGLSQLDALADQLREAGLPVETTIEGEPRPLPSSLELCAYRSSKRHSPTRSSTLVPPQPLSPSATGRARSRSR